MGRSLTELWKEERWPTRWIAGEGEPLRLARRTLLRQFWTVYLPFLFLLALLVGLSEAFPTGPLQALLASPVFWLATAAVGFGAPAFALTAHLRRIWRYALQRRGPGTFRVRAYAVVIALGACGTMAGLCFVAWVAWRYSMVFPRAA